ncbi:uncharacterized protein LOC110452185 [Mizuhopecten yessoensis]|nr:uncharacterized protein LOC110452185 [Mizuhopecten yessoensis]
MGNQESKGDQNQQDSQKEIFIHTFSEDLLSDQVDGIVCFTDRNWSSDNLCCQLLAKHGGNQYASERQAIKHDNKDCQPGNVYVGDSGMLPCKKVFFCVVTENELTEGSGRYDQKAVTMVTNILDKASREEFFSLAIIIEGNDAGPNPTCLIPLIYCKFLLLSSTLQEIHLVALDEALIDLMQKVLRESHQLSVSQESVPGDQGPRNRSPPDNENLTADTRQDTSTQDKPPGSVENGTTQESAENSASEEGGGVDESYVNNIMGIEDVKIQPSTDDPRDEVDETELGAVGGLSPATPEFTQYCYSSNSDDGYEDDDKITKTMFKRGDSTISTASQEDNLDFVNILNSASVKKGMKHLAPIVDPVSPASPAKTFVCSICMEEKGPLLLKTLDKCRHMFCKECITKHLQIQGTCPICKHRYSDPQGNQPDGVMSYFIAEDTNLAGYESVGTIVIEYDIPDGIQSECHPNPGHAYKGLHRSAFLPDNPDGQRILLLLQKAFDKKLIFTVGTSITTGRENVTTWNDIHHKTNIKGGAQRFGYPDPTYLRRVYDELIAKGITEEE